VKIGLQIPKFDWPGGLAQLGTKLTQIARAAEEADFYSLWVMDHFFQLEPVLGKVDDLMLESYSTLSYLAGKTEKVRLGTLVTGVVYRHPGHLIKSVTNLDVLSGGRAYLGIGAAWNEREAKGLGLPFPPIRERFERLEETLQIVRQVWSGDFAPFQGKHYQLLEPIISPQPLSQPHPPILVGGGGEKKTLRLVAQYADACNLFGRLEASDLSRKLDVLRRHCDEVGRPYQEIEITALDTVHLAPGQMTPADVIDHCRHLADLGFQHLIFNMPNVQDITPLEVFGREIIPAVREF
jgi:F420-dependent oxidoreductase-like protein